MISLSIITINYNNSIGLEKTFKSVFAQTWTNFEYIVIDGGSSDKSIDLIKLFNSKIDYWVSENDSGVYNAMNKGILKAHGKYLLFLNSGDTLLNSNILNNVNTFLKSDIDILYGNQLVLELDGTLNKCIYPSKLYLSFFFNSSLPHQATFIKRDLFFIHGLYEEKYKIVSDWKFFFDLIIYKNVTYQYIDFDISLFEQGGLNFSQRKLGVFEREEIFRLDYPLFYDDIIKFREMRTRIKYIENSKLFFIPLIIEKLKNWTRNYRNYFKIRT
jgi:glycosyltransferase involved in cell wall biosynthesis